MDYDVILKMIKEMSPKVYEEVMDGDKVSIEATFDDMLAESKDEEELRKKVSSYVRLMEID